jgi:myo-inositol-1(or 4)-monophosphatase
VIQYRPGEFQRMEQNALEELLRRLRRAADEELMTRFNRVGARVKTDGSMVTEADLAMQGRMQRELAGLFPDFGFLGEEMEPGRRQSQMDRKGAGLWVLDPLDGTSNYVAGIPYFAVSLALVIDRRVALAVVYDPSRQELFHALAGQGTLLNGAPLARHDAPEALRKAIAVVDYKRLPAELARRLAATPPYGSQRSFGSVALDFCWIAAGRGHVYLHGRHNLWDYAAGLTILHEAGGHSTSLHGCQEPALDLQPRSTAAALDAALFAEWCSWLGITVRQA